MTALPILSLIVFLPWVGAALLALLPKIRAATSRTIGLVFSGSTLALSAWLLSSFDRTSSSYQFVEHHGWITALNVHYYLGVDGLSLLLVVLTGLIGPVSLLASRSDQRAPRLFNLLFLVLQGAALGVFLSLDFVHWFLFWELSLVPAFFLIKLWGGPGATRAAYQFFVYTIGGSAFMLLGFAAIFVTTRALDFPTLTHLAAEGALNARLDGLGATVPQWVFLGVLLGLAVKVPLFPLHTWLPDAYAEAPTGASMFLTAVMSKMGVYGFLRILWPLFPSALHSAAPYLIWLALGGVVLGAFAAMRQTDLKRMVAYSSINHVSYCLLALFAVASGTRAGGASTLAATSALGGALLQMFNHGLSAAALFASIGILESRSGGRRGLNDFGGVRSVAPLFAGLCGVAMFSSLGLPALNGFVGEFFIFRGVWGFTPWAASVACLGLFATAFFLLTFWQRVFHGPRGSGSAPFADLSAREVVTLGPLAVLMVLFGVAPQLLTVWFNPLVSTWANQLNSP